MPVDPFTEGYTALWALLENHAGFTGLVRAGNRVKFTGNKRDPVKQEVQEADLPEVRLVPAGSVIHLWHTSNGSSAVQHYSAQLATGDLRLDAALFPVKWEIVKALSKSDPAHYVNGYWLGLAHVKKVGPVHESTQGILDAELNRGKPGWAEVLRISVEHWFRTVDLQA